MFGEVSLNEVFCDHHGVPVLNGAMGVDKWKEIDGEQIHLLRFICIFCPVNAYMRKLRGDSDLLPFLPQMNMLSLDSVHTEKTLPT